MFSHLKRAKAVIETHTSQNPDSVSFPFPEGTASVLAENAGKNDLVTKVEGRRESDLHFVPFFHGEGDLSMPRALAPWEQAQPNF